MHILVAAIVAAGILAAGTARAEYLYEFGKSSYTVLPGDTVNVSVYLVETGTTELTSSGLVGADFLVDWSGNSAAVTSVTANTNFTFAPTVTIGSTSAELLLGTTTPVEGNPLFLVPSPFPPVRP